MERKNNFYSYKDGKILPLNEIKIDPYDLGFLRGYAVFDFMQVIDQKPFLAEEHFKRLENSARSLSLSVPINLTRFKKIILTLTKKNNLKNCSIRTIVTGGKSKNTLSSSRPSIFILIEKTKPLPRNLYEKGVKLITVAFKREIPRSKTTNYAEALKFQRKKEVAGAFEILYTKEKKVLEASTSNFFIFKKNKLITPKDNVLSGITRNLIVKLARKHFQIEERNILIQELEKCDESFLTATGKGVLPVVKINNKKIGSSKPGERTKILMDEYRKFVEEY